MKLPAKGGPDRFKSNQFLAQNSLVKCESITWKQDHVKCAHNKLKSYKDKLWDDQRFELIDQSCVTFSRGIFCSDKNWNSVRFYEINSNPFNLNGLIENQREHWKECLICVKECINRQTLCILKMETRKYQQWILT